MEVHKRIFIRFTSPQIMEPSQYKVFASTFSQFGITTKLYLDYKKKYGKVYFESKFDAQKAYNYLKKSNTLSMSLDPPAEEFTNTKKKYEEDDVQVEIEEENLYDLYGNVITIFKADDGEKYVPFNSLCLSGYKLFTENITAKYRKANQVDMENLESFLNLQLQTYLILHKISLDSVDVPRLMKKCTSVFTKRLESTNSKPIQIQRTVINHSFVELPKSKPSIYDNERSERTVLDHSSEELPKSKPSIYDNERSDEFIGTAEYHNIEKLTTDNEPAVAPEQDMPTTSRNDRSRRPENVEQPDSNRKSIAEMSVLKGYLRCQSIINKNLLIVSTYPFDPPEFVKYSNLLDQIEADYDPQYKPLVGTTVAIDYKEDENIMARAVILSEINNEYICAVIDYGKLETTKKVYRLPDKLKDIVEFSMICETEDDLTDLVEFNEEYTFSCSENKIELIIDKKIYNAIATKWDPSLNRKTFKRKR